MATGALTRGRTADWHRRYRTFAWALVVFTVAVIVSGDIVQATESGAGCGESWPRCQGSLVPSIGNAQTAVEFTHRMATSLLTLGFIALAVGAWRLYGREHRVWRMAAFACGVLLLEILIGASLVLFGWVETNASWGRVIADSVHVVNTFLLVGSVAMVAWFAGGGGVPRIDRRRRVDRLLLAAGVIVIAIAITGTIDSLADTLALSDEVDIDATPIAAILVDIRGIHPLLAVTGGVGIIWLMTQLSDLATGMTLRMVLLVQAVVVTQAVVGVLNIALLTPLETQIVHLILADVLWLTVLMLGARMLSPAGRAAMEARATP
jgi:cytochrome c oxidase assembly protein subunit 15